MHSFDCPCMPCAPSALPSPHPLLQLEGQAAAHTAALAETRAATQALSADLAQARADRTAADARLQEVAAEVRGPGEGREALITLWQELAES